MEIFTQFVYEYQKGIRDLILYTCCADMEEKIIQLLQKYNIAYKIYPIGKEKINVFFGARECITILESFSSKSLCEFTPEEDFILGIMLGYSRQEQYRRILERKMLTTS